MTGCTATEAATGQKAVLFCDHCRYHAPVDGAWEPTDDPHRLRCPNCGTITG